MAIGLIANFNKKRQSYVDILSGFFTLCLTSELCLTGAVTDLTRNSQTPREGDFGSVRDLNH